MKYEIDVEEKEMKIYEVSGVNLLSNGTTVVCPYCKAHITITRVPTSEAILVEWKHDKIDNS